MPWGLETVVSETIGFALEAIEREKAPPIPLSLHSQARLAARNGVGFETVVQRYLAGLLTINEFVDQEAAPGPGPATAPPSRTPAQRPHG
jgi:hypothetical protein